MNETEQNKVDWDKIKEMNNKMVITIEGNNIYFDMGDRTFYLEGIKAEPGVSIDTAEHDVAYLKLGCVAIKLYVTKDKGEQLGLCNIIIAGNPQDFLDEIGESLGEED